MRAWQLVVGGFLLVTTLAIVLVAITTIARRPGPVRAEEVVLTLATHDIRQLDPLLLKVTLKNDSGQPLLLDYDASGEGWQVPLEIVQAETGRREVIPGTGGEMNCMLDTGVRVTIPPSGRFVTYELLYWGGPEWPFPEPGTYFLRARVDLGPDALWSNLATLRVTRIPDSDRELIESTGQVSYESGASENAIYQTFGRGRGHLVADSSYFDPEVQSARTAKLELIENQLSGSYLKRSLAWKRGLSTIRWAENADERRRAREKLQALRRQLDPVTNEVVELALARSYYHSRQWEEASQVLQGIEERSHGTQEIREAVRQHEWETKREAERARGILAIGPEDRRLDVQTGYWVGLGEYRDIRHRVAQPATFADVLEFLSAHTKVPLDAEGAFKSFPVSERTTELTSLRSHMYSWSQHFKGTWTRRGEGYFLAPITKPESQPSEPGK